MPKKLDDKEILGKKFNRLTVVKFSHYYIMPKTGIRTGRMYECLCECGKTVNVLIQNIVSGSIRSCGCYRNDKLSKATRKHGLGHTTLYNTWSKLIRRCMNPEDRGYHNYGGRGIKVCEEWLLDFLSFYKWATENGWKKGLSIDRINNDGDYEPNNCRWVTQKVNCRNRRGNLFITYREETKTLAEWCEILGLDYGLTHQRMDVLGKSFEFCVENKEKRFRKGRPKIA